MLIAVIAFTFFVPMVLKAKSKGYNPAPIVIPTIFLAAAGSFLQGAVGALAVPAIALLIVHFLPEKEGAPGKAYFRHTFECPECGDSVTFKRGREGLVDLCPKCGDLITIPQNEDETQDLVVRDEPSKPLPVSADADLVVVRSYEARPYAELALGMLDGAGIAGILQSNDGGAVFPHLCEYRVFVASSDLDEADRILGESEAEVE